MPFTQVLPQSLLEPIYLLVGGLITVLFGILRWRFTISTGPNEPYLLPSGWIPGFTHLWGLIRQGQLYAVTIHRRYGKPICTMQVLSGRMYMAVTPEWAEAVQKSPKALSFEPVVFQAMRSLLLLDTDAMRVVTEKPGDDSNHGMWRDVLRATHLHLAPGQGADTMGLRFLNKFATKIINVSPTDSFRLWEWMRHNMTMTASYALYGSRSPFDTHPDAEPYLWQFVDSSIPLSSIPLPQYLVRKGWNARQYLFRIFQEFVDNKTYNDEDCSALIKARAEVCFDGYELRPEAFARSEIFMTMGAVINTVPTTFWLISYIFQDPKLLEEVRCEIDHCIEVSEITPCRRTIHIDRLQKACPLFYSIFREVLRIAGPLSSTRIVTEDTTLTNASGETVFFKKDNAVFIPGNVIHEDPATWGPDAHLFNARRFEEKGTKARDPAGNHVNQPSRAAYRSFGGGIHLCPGREFQRPR